MVLLTLGFPLFILSEIEFFATMLWILAFPRILKSSPVPSRSSFFSRIFSAWILPIFVLFQIQLNLYQPFLLFSQDSKTKTYPQKNSHYTLKAINKKQKVKMIKLKI